MNLIDRLRLFALMAMMSMSVAVFGQSNGDKLFMEGQKLQQTQTVASQKAAIKKFQSAKVVYTTAEKKKMCDNQIKICNNNISIISKPKTSAKKTTAEPVSPVFELSQSLIEFEGDKAGNLAITVTAPAGNWSFSIPKGMEGETDFVKATRNNDSSGITIEADANPTTIGRKQTVNFTYENESKSLTVTQKGKPVKLGTSENILEFTYKGGKKTLELYTNSDSLTTYSNGQYWYVESQPDWIEIRVAVKKTKGILGKGLSAIKGLVSSTSEIAQDADIKTSNLEIVAQQLKGDDRKGEIVFASQYERFVVSVTQSKK